MIRRGFTLLEIMVSLLIFSVVSLALIGVLSAAVKLFRAGESSRAANDETIAALAQLDDDLKRIVPAADGGFLYTKTKATNGHSAGNMVLAFKIRNPDGGTIDEKGVKARLVVVWWVGDDGTLNRRSDTAADSDANTATVSELDVAKAIYGNPQPIANGCLYFGLDLSEDLTPRPDLAWSTHVPLSTVTYSTEPIIAGSTPDPFPAALRVTLTLTGGSRNVVHGRVIRDEGGDLRITGVGQVPIAPGSMARIGDPTNPANTDVEWITYTGFQGSLLTCSAGRAQRRTANLGGGVTGFDVFFAPSYSIVRTLPR